DLLGIERIGRQDHFFELGGHSLLAIKLIERLRQAGYTLAVSDLFRQPTLAVLAATLTGSDTAMAVPANRIHADSTHITPAMLPLVTLTQTQIDTVVTTVPGGRAQCAGYLPAGTVTERHSVPPSVAAGGGCVYHPLHPEL
ncbi:phosphopantetheine-binding protein, partial [Dickeya ananatis]